MSEMMEEAQGKERQIVRVGFGAEMGCCSCAVGEEVIGRMAQIVGDVYHSSMEEPPSPAAEVKLPQTFWLCLMSKLSFQSMASSGDRIRTRQMRAKEMAPLRIMVWDCWQLISLWRLVISLVTFSAYLLWGVLRMNHFLSSNMVVNRLGSILKGSLKSSCFRTPPSQKSLFRPYLRTKFIMMIYELITINHHPQIRTNDHPPPVEATPIYLFQKETVAPSNCSVQATIELNWKSPAQTQTQPPCHLARLSTPNSRSPLQPARHPQLALLSLIDFFLPYETFPVMILFAQPSPPSPAHMHIHIHLFFTWKIVQSRALGSFLQLLHKQNTVRTAEGVKSECGGLRVRGREEQSSDGYEWYDEEARLWRWCVVRIIQIIVAQSMESCSGEEFQLGEVVWAKVIGYPWWPGTVTQVSPHRPQVYRIDFFFDHSHAYLGHQKLSKYPQLRDHIDTHRHMSKGLRKAVIEADKVHSLFVKGGDSSPSATLQAEVPLPTQKQLLQPHLLQEQASVHQQQHSLSPQQSQPLSEEEEQGEKTPQLYSREQREKYVNTLLKKYGLNCLPRVVEEEEPKSHRKGQKRQGRRGNYKSRMISKVAYEGHSLMFLLTRKIYSMLGGKQLPMSQRREISLSLGKQVLGGAEQANALFKWISISEGQAIANFYQSWGSMQGEKEKNSSMTTVE